ncbi:hypothetical protein BOTBODRAFT_158388 [Botryobasidium botryosum FD-172 SS1]|uniref:Uncharacterized protein n=1 Tax=Botryobasidium botryosum (strain FD-172 SS1) TaxID=930990 RepID=A0A067MVC4_BOTB1|nr:hypothetical protein BOTBODRAFT_158388 [Botryobasidium botryosum FD-172 SS1]
MFSSFLLAQTQNLRDTFNLENTTSQPTRDPAQPKESAASPSPTRAVSCATCRDVITGQLVRAIGSIYHFDCFKCLDCDALIASKFFPIEDGEGEVQALCERDYFRRLDLLCAKCDQAIRGPYVTAIDQKYHVDHLTCSVCPTKFGPNDSYYEHEGQLYCRYHYSTRCARKCSGCNVAILSQFVEINRDGKDEDWHINCYKVQKCWDVRWVVRAPEAHSQAKPPSTTSWAEEEAQNTPVFLHEEQMVTEKRIERAWDVFSLFEESAAAIVSDTLRYFDNQRCSDLIHAADRFVAHVEVLFAVIDNVVSRYASVEVKGIRHVREAQMLCQKTIDMLTLLSRRSEERAPPARRASTAEDLSDLSAGIGRYIGVLLRAILTACFTLEHGHGDERALDNCLDMLEKFASELSLSGAPIRLAGRVVYGYQILQPNVARRSRLPLSDSDESPGLCLGCGKAIEGQCVMLGPTQRWHPQCIECIACGKTAEVLAINRNQSASTSTTSSRSLVPAVEAFLFEADRSTSARGASLKVYCQEHATPSCQGGFSVVTRLEQYAYLLVVALSQARSALYRIVLKSAVSGSITQKETSTSSGSLSIKHPRAMVLDREILSVGSFRPVVQDVRKKSPRVSGSDSTGFAPLETQFDRSTSALVSSPKAMYPDEGSDASILTTTESDAPRPLRHHDNPYIAELLPNELLLAKYFAIVRLQQSPLRSYVHLEKIIELMESKKGLKWNKVLKVGGAKKNVFGVPLEELIVREGVDCTMGAAPTTLRVPALIKDVILAMKKKAVSADGIFRLNGNVKQLRELAEAVDQGSSNVELSHETPIQLAALLKKFLRELPEPLFTPQLYELLVISQTLPIEEERERYLQLILLLLPPCNRDTVEVLFVFLKWITSLNHEEASNIDAAYLAASICPNVLYPTSTVDDPHGHEKAPAAHVISRLIESPADIYCVPDDFLAILRGQENLGDLSGLPFMEGLKRCDNYLRGRKQPGRSPGPLSMASLASSLVSYSRGLPGKHIRSASELSTKRSRPQEDLLDLGSATRNQFAPQFDWIPASFGSRTLDRISSPFRSLSATITPGPLSLHESVCLASLSEVRLLLDMEEDVHARDSRGDTPIHVLCRAERRARWEAFDGDTHESQDYIRGRSSSAKSFESRRLANTIQLILAALLDAGADIESRNNKQQTPLYLAVALNSSLTVEALIDANANADVSADTSTTALHLAVQQSDLHVCALLLTAGADALRPDHFGLTPVSYAMQNESVELLKLLLKPSLAPRLKEDVLRSMTGLREDLVSPKLSQDIRQRKLEILQIMYSRTGVFPNKPDLQEYEVKRLSMSGQGGFGECYRGAFLGKFDVALKCLRIPANETALSAKRMKKPNILVSEFGDACIADFGLARPLVEASNCSYSTNWMHAGNPRWQAPELLMDNEEEILRTTASDVFSFGRVIIEILTGEHPFRELRSEAAAIVATVKGDLPLRPEGDAVIWGLDDQVWDLFRECCSLEATERPQMSTIVPRLWRIQHLRESSMKS